MMDKQRKSVRGPGPANGAIVRDRIMAKVLRIIDDCAPTNRRLKVLEAGGGSTTRVAIPREHDIVTVDISPDQLERNTYATECILADLQEFTGHDGRYDLVICWNVLEHVRQPLRAFDNMHRALAAGGYMLIACPCPFSLKGVLTKLSPHAFHVWYYRRVRGDERAGLPGRFPFPTHMRREIALPALTRQSVEAGLEVVVAEYYTAPAIEELQYQSRLLHTAYATLSGAARAASFGRYRPDDSDYILLVRKPPETRP